MIVIKLGGSLYGTAELKEWLKVLSEQAQHHAIVIVPGGGPFADQVRDAQQYHHFNDSYAHHMAILAMSQFGLLISSLCDQYQHFSIPEQEHLQSTGLFIWLPDSHLLSETDLTHSWDITSDSLALWLANQLQAEQLILVKKVNTKVQSISELISLNILDLGFKSLFSKNQVDSYIINASDYSLIDKDIPRNTVCKLLLP